MNSNVEKHQNILSEFNTFTISSLAYNIHLRSDISKELSKKHEEFENKIYNNIEKNLENKINQRINQLEKNLQNHIDMLFKKYITEKLESAKNKINSSDDWEKVEPENQDDRK